MPEPIRRTTARVLPVKAQGEEAEMGNLLAARWWFPDDPASAGGAVAEDMPTIMGAAVRAVLDGAR